MTPGETLEVIESALHYHFWNEWIRDENPRRVIDEQGWIYDNDQYAFWRKRYATVKTEQHSTYILLSVQCYHLDKYPRGAAAFGFEIRIRYEADKKWIVDTIERLYEEARHKRYKEVHKQVMDDLEESEASE